MAHWSIWLASAGLLFGAGLGLRGLLDPRWAAGLVRLREETEKPGGIAEFRATFGGLFLASQLVAMAGVGARLHGGNDPLAAAAPGAVLVCAAMWLGTAVGRMVSMALDGAGTRFNQASTAVEIGVGLAILSPWLTGALA